MWSKPIKVDTNTAGFSLPIYDIHMQGLHVGIIRTATSEISFSINAITERRFINATTGSGRIELAARFIVGLFVVGVCCFSLVAVFASCVGGACDALAPQPIVGQ